MAESRTQRQRLTIAAVADADTITGLCLGGIGAKDDSGSTNVLQVTAETTQEHIETTVQGFLDDATIGIVILSQTVAGRVRHVLRRHGATLPTVLELPDKGSTYEPMSDPIMSRVGQLLGTGGR